MVAMKGVCASVLAGVALRAAIGTSLPIWRCFLVMSIVVAYRFVMRQIEA